VLPEDSPSVAFRRGKQKEKAGAESGPTSDGKQTNKREQSVFQPLNTFLIILV